jgi:DNA ligase-4
MQCRFEQQCILEKEILVYSDRTQQTIPFYQIRKHVSRAGRYPGRAENSLTSDDEHLTIMFYDLLLLGDILCVRELYD